jgi:hypothetical protein
MKTKNNISPLAPNSLKLLSVLIAIVVLSPSNLWAVYKVHKRHAIVYLSDGTSYQGTVMLSPGMDFSMARMKDKSDDKSPKIVDVKRHGKRVKIFTFNFNLVKDMTFSPRSEEYLKKFKILNVTNRHAKVEKVRFGLAYPVMKPKCTVVFNSGETALGIVATRVVYLKVLDPETGMRLATKKFVIKSKYSGKPGQSFDDLVHVKRIKMLDKGDEFAQNLEIDFRSFKSDSANKLHGVRALTKGTLSKVLVRKDADGKVRVHSTLGENVYLAAEVNGKWVAGWPAEGTKRTELFKSVEAQINKVSDYYNEKKLLGIISKNHGKEIIALVRLRRDIPDPEAALRWAKAVGGGFEMGADGKLEEFYRMSIWRFVRDNKTEKMALVDRGTFCRIKIDLEDKTPAMGISPDLWPAVIKDGKLIVGRNNQKAAR